jgi:hypothetical protein
MNGADLFSRMQNAILLIDRMRRHFLNVEENIQQSLTKIRCYQDEIKAVQTELQSNMMEFYNHQMKSPSTSIISSAVNKPLPEMQDSNQPKSSSSMKHTEPMSVKDAIAFLRRSKVHLSDYGYYLCGSVETRYNALKEAMVSYPIEEILQKLRALIIVWSQNAADKIQNAENYLNHLRTDFHTLQEEILKPKRT